jgi:hypothetical protein
MMADEKVVSFIRKLANIGEGWRTDWRRGSLQSQAEFSIYIGLYRIVNGFLRRRPRIVTRAHAPDSAERIRMMADGS